MSEKAETSAANYFVKYSIDFDAVLNAHDTS